MRSPVGPLPPATEKELVTGEKSRLHSSSPATGVLSVMAFHEKAGRSQVDSSLASLNKVFLSRRVATVAMLPSALFDERLVRSVQVGRSRFSRCCHLFIALWFRSCRVEPGPGHSRSHCNSALGFVFLLSQNLFKLPSAMGLDCCCATARTLLHSPTSDAVVPPQCSRNFLTLPQVLPCNIPEARRQP